LEQATLSTDDNLKKELTEKVNAADLMRDRCFIGFQKHLEADKYNDWEAGTGDAAIRLLDIIAKHGSHLHEERHHIQSKLMYDLFEDLRGVQAQKDLEALGLAAWLTQMENYQESFAVVYQDLIELEETESFFTKAEVKAMLAPSFSMLVTGLNYLASVKPESYEKTNKGLESIIMAVVDSQEMV